MIVKFNDRLGSRSLRHMNLLVASVGDEQVIFEFAGQSVPGVVTVVREDHEKNGKWSHTTWTVGLAEGVGSFSWHQDWERGTYLTAGTWSAAMEQVRSQATGVELTDAAIERFVRARLPKFAAKFDRAAETATADPTPILRDLIAAQTELAEAQAAKVAADREHRQLATEIQQAIDARAAAEQARREAAETAERVAAAKTAMKKGASLADLQALLSA
jgi:hypothetical protein